MPAAADADLLSIHPLLLPLPTPHPTPLQVKEPSLESLARGKKVYEPPRFMSVATACQQLLEVEESRGQGAYAPDSLCVGLARLGSDSQRIVAGTLAQLAEQDLGPPLHSLVIAGDTHPIEEEYLAQFRVGAAQQAAAAAAGGGGADAPTGVVVP